MAVLSTTTKGKIGLTAGKTTARNPRWIARAAEAARPAGKISFKVGKPVAKRRVRQRVGQLSDAVEQLNDAARTVGETLAIKAPQAAYELGLAEPPKPKRTAPRVAAGVVIGASAMYFLEPGHGREHREKVAQMVG